MMKLRQLVLDSFPMGRNRKKKDKEKSHLTKTTPPVGYPGSYQVPFIQKRRRSPVPAPPPQVPENKYSNMRLAAKSKENDNLVPDMRTISLNDTPTSPVSQKSDYSLNFNTTDTKFQCFKHIAALSPSSDRGHSLHEERLTTFIPKSHVNTPHLNTPLRHSYSSEPYPPSRQNSECALSDRHSISPERTYPSNYPAGHSFTNQLYTQHRSFTPDRRVHTPDQELHYCVSPALDTCSDSNSSLNRPRTRIKTNPWLPSPRGSSASSGSSPAYSPTDIYSPMARKSFPQEAIYEEIPGCKDSPVHYNIQPRNRLGSNGSDVHTDNESLRQSHVSDSDNSFMSWSMERPPSYNKSLQMESSFDENPSDLMEHNDLKHNDLEHKDMENDCVKINDDKCDQKSLDSQVSFHYEEVFESQIEAQCDDLSSNGSMSDGYASDEDEVFLASAYSVFASESDINSLDSASLSKVSAIVSDYDMSESDSEVWKRRNDSSGESDDTICEYEGEYDLQNSTIIEPLPRIRRYHKSPRRRTSPRRKSQPVPMSPEPVDKHEIHKNETNKHDTHETQKTDVNDNEINTRLMACKLSDVSSLDSGADSGLYSMDSVSLDRSIGEIKSSLQDKVHKLRQDKLLVDEKIRQAQEEDRIRMQEKMRFQKQVTQHRKQMLLSTLQDLKAKLENQSQRLQSTYSSVLHMQKHMIRQRKHMSAHEISAADASEAPF